MITVALVKFVHIISANLSAFLDTNDFILSYDRENFEIRNQSQNTKELDSVQEHLLLTGTHIA